MTSLGHVVDLSDDFESAVDRTIEALGAEGFGVLTRVDLDQAFREKLGVEFRRFAILGACNPALAHRALCALPEVGLLLPCNVTVEETAGGTRVRLVNAEAMMATAGLDDNAAIQELGRDAGARLARVAASLQGG